MDKIEGVSDINDFREECWRLYNQDPQEYVGTSCLHNCRFWGDADNLTEEQRCQCKHTDMSNWPVECPVAYDKGWRLVHGEWICYPTAEDYAQSSGQDVDKWT